MPKKLEFQTTTRTDRMQGPQGVGFGSVHTAIVDGREHRDAVKVWSDTPEGNKAAEELLRKLGGGR